MKILAKDKEFTKFRRTFGEQGFMDIDTLANVANEHVPFNVEHAINNSSNRKVTFVATHRHNGKAAYFNPKENNWINKVVASCTLPFVTKGRHLVNGEEYFDGGWADGLPVKWAYEQGAKDILIVRSRPKEIPYSQSWMDYFASIYYKSNPDIQKVFALAHEKYNENMDFIEKAPKDLKVSQIAPSKILKSGTYSYSKKTIMRDYRYGLDLGLRYLNAID